MRRDPGGVRRPGSAVGANGRIAATLKIARGKIAVGGRNPGKRRIEFVGPAMGRAILCPTPTGPWIGGGCFYPGLRPPTSALPREI